MREKPNMRLHASAASIVLALGVGLPPAAAEGGLLFLASYRAGDPPAAMADPRIEGALVTYYWSQIESQPEQYDWSDIDRRIQLWAAAGKKVVVRIVWSADGNWPHPSAKRPTPQWVFERGAAMVVAARSKTQVPLPWDPVYVQYAHRFMNEMAKKYDGNPSVLFVDLTPGAETHPYRYSMDPKDPQLRQAFLQASASDGSRYSDARWLATVQHHIAAATGAFRRTPVLVTLNEGLFQQIGNAAVAGGCYTGQNGLKGDSYLKPRGPWLLAFQKWGRQTRLYFEMFGPSGPKNGTLMDHVRAAERVGADYLCIYAEDVLQAVPGQPRFDPAHAEALTYGAQVVGKDSVATRPPRSD